MKRKQRKRVILLWISFMMVCIQIGSYQVHASNSYDISTTPVELTNSYETVELSGNSDINTVHISGGAPTLHLNNVSIEAPNKDLTASQENSDNSKPAIYITDGANVIIEVIGTNKLVGGAYRAGIQVDKGASVTIVGSGSLDVSTAGKQNTSASGIGGGSIYVDGSYENIGMPAGQITIGGSVQITAKGGWGSAAIGAAGYVGNRHVESVKDGFESITIKDQAQVTTQEPAYSSAIGAGYQLSTDINEYYENGVGNFTIQDHATLTLAGTGTDESATSFAKESIIAKINYLGGTIIPGTYSQTEVSPTLKNISFVGNQGVFLKDTDITYKAAKIKNNDIETLYNTITRTGHVGSDGILQDAIVFSGSNYLEATTANGTKYRAIFTPTESVIQIKQCTCQQPLSFASSLPNRIYVPFSNIGNHEFDVYVWDDSIVRFHKDGSCPLEDYLHVSDEPKITTSNITMSEKQDNKFYHFVIPETAMNSTVQITAAINLNGRDISATHSLSVIKKDVPQIEDLTIETKDYLQSGEEFTITLTGSHMEAFQAQNARLTAVLCDNQYQNLSQFSFYRIKDNQWQANIKAPVNRTDKNQTYHIAVTAIDVFDAQYIYNPKTNLFYEPENNAAYNACYFPLSVQPKQDISSFSLNDGALKISQKGDAIQVNQEGKEPIILSQKKLSIVKGTDVDNWKSLYGEEDYKTQPFIEIEDGVDVEINIDGDVLKRLGDEYTAHLIEGKDNVSLKLSSISPSLLSGDISLGDKSQFYAGELAIEGNLIADEVYVEKAGFLFVGETLTAQKLLVNQGKILVSSLNVSDSVVFNESFTYFGDISQSVLPVLNHSIFGVENGVNGILKNSQNQTLKATDLSVLKIMSYGNYPFPLLGDVVFSTNSGENWHTIDLRTKTIVYDILAILMAPNAFLYVPDETSDVFMKIADRIYNYNIDSKDFSDEIILHLNKNKITSTGINPQAVFTLENKGTIDIPYVNYRLSGQDAEKMMGLSQSRSSQMMDIVAGKKKDVMIGLKDGVTAGTYHAELTVSIGYLELYTLPITLIKQEKVVIKPEIVNPSDDLPIIKPEVNPDFTENSDISINQNNQVKTQDDSSIGLYTSILIVAIAVIGGICWYSVKKKKDKQ